MPDNWHTKGGQPVSAVYGYTKFLLDFLEQSGMPTHCAAAFDESLGSNYRNDIYPLYKASRELPDEELAFQLDACRRITECLGIPAYGGSRYEADDYIATLANLSRKNSIPVTVVTRDKDLGQLILGQADNWWDFAKGELIDASAFAQRFGVRPEQFADYLALVGDPVDDIPGVPGVGPKTAARLLQEFSTLEQLAKGLGSVADLSIRGAAGIAQKLQDNWAQVLLARQLTGLEENIPELGTLPSFQLQPDNVKATSDYLGELNIRGPLLGRCKALEKTLGNS
jgi:5'-3' exonuclease